MAVWKNISHGGYGVITYTLEPSTKVVNNYTPSFTVPPGKDFTVICNYDAANTSISCHIEMFYADTPGGTFRARTKTSGYYFNATSATIDTATVVVPVDVSAQGEYPCYKLKLASTGIAETTPIKFVVFWGKSPDTNV